jgi:hypothetical protein
VPQRNVQNIGNYFMTSNHSLPIKLSETDRRFLVLDVSNEYAQPAINDKERAAKVARNRDYFNGLDDVFENPRFYPTVHTFFMQRDLTGWDWHHFPATDAKAALSDANTPAVEMFLQSYAGRLTSKIQVCKLHELYSNFCKRHGFHPVALNRIAHELEPYGIEKTMVHGAAHVQFNEEGLERFEEFLGNDGTDCPVDLTDLA